MKLNIQRFAIVAVTPQPVEMNTPKVVALTSGSTDGVTVLQKASDENMMIVVYNSSVDTAYDLTIVKPAEGKGTFAASPVDVVTSIPAGQIAMIMVESAKFLDVTTGKITLNVSNAALKFAVFYNK